MLDARCTLERRLPCRGGLHCARAVSVNRVGWRRLAWLTWLALAGCAEVHFADDARAVRPDARAVIDAGTDGDGDSDLDAGEAPDAGLVAGIPGDRRVTELTDAEWRAFCQWVESLLDGEPLMYACIGATRVDESSGACDTGDCQYYDFTEEWCFANFPPAFRIQIPDCMMNVRQWADCHVASIALECHAAYPRPVECDAFFACSG